MQICHIVGDSKFGGATKLIVELAKYTENAGHRVCILTADSTTQAFLKNQNINYIDLDCIRRTIHPVWDIKGLIVLVNHLRSSSYDLIHTHTSKAGFVGRLAGRIAGIPHIVHTAHGFAFHEKSNAATISTYTTLEKLATLWCDRLVTVSQFHRSWAIDLNISSEQKIVAIPNGIADFQIPADFKKDNTRSELGIEPDETMILSVGRLAKQKGYEDLLHAANLLRHENFPRFKIIIAGVGPLREKLQSLHAKLNLGMFVKFIGFHKLVYELFSAADIVVQSSLREGMSIALLEALAMGKPIVTTDIGSNLEVIGEDGPAIIVPRNNPEGLAKGIAKYLKDSSLRETYSKRARELYLQEYKQEKMLAAYLRLYTELYNSRS